MSFPRQESGGFNHDANHVGPATEHWKKQNVLSFDGGGIRGYYSLLHLNFLMQHIKLQEEKLSTMTNDDGMNSQTLSSFAPCIEPKNVSYSTTAESHFLPCHYFDYISGTSTGGLITIMLATLRMSVQDCLDEYKKLAGFVFSSPRRIHQAGQLGIFVAKNKYATTNLEDAIKDVMRRRGEVAHDHDDAMQFRTLKGLCRAIVLANRDVLTGKDSGILSELWLFRSYDNFRSRDEKPGTSTPLNPGRGTKFAAWKVARAATAAKMFFKPLEIALDDGEVILPRKQSRRFTIDPSAGPSQKGGKSKSRVERKTALLHDAGFSRVNNPSMEVRKELMSIFGDGPKKIENWVSVGTARGSPPTDMSSFLAVLRRAVAHMGDPEIEHEAMDKLTGRDFEYFRLNEPNSLGNVEMDHWLPRKPRSKDSGLTTIQTMENAFNKWAKNPNNAKLVEKAAKNLVQIRRARARNTSMWERFALGRFYFCPAKDCHLDMDETWHYRDSFTQHLETVHGYTGRQVETALASHRDWDYKSSDRYQSS